MVRLPSALNDPGGQGPGFPPPFDAGTPREPGVHLHWAMPDALLRGHLSEGTDRNRLALPALPDRWTVLRLLAVPDAETVSVRGWVLEADRTQGSRPTSPRPKVQLTPKESLIVSCVTQGMKNKEIALRVGTTEQVVKNYLRKVYDKLGVADRLELALFCLHNRVLDGGVKVPAAPVPSSGNGSAQELAPASTETVTKPS